LYDSSVVAAGRRRAIVVGAGPAGLAAARGLCGRGFAVTLIEAAARAGGGLGTWRDLPGGAVAEAGPDRIEADEDETLFAARSLGLRLVPAPGDRFFCRKGRLSKTLDGLGLSSDVQALLAPGGEVEAALRTHYERLRTPLWRTGDERTWALDGMTFVEFLSTKRLHFVDLVEALDLVHLPRRGIPLREANALAAIEDVYEALYRPPAAPPARIEGGMDALVRGFLAEIEARGGRLLYEAPVVAVRERDRPQRAVEVAWAGARPGAAEAEVAVLAVPPRALAGIVFDPPLDSEKVALIARAGAGSAVRVALVFDARFWQPLGLHGWAEVLGEGFLGRIAADAGEGGGPAALTVTAYGDEAERLLARPPEARAAAVLDALEALYPRARAHLVAGGERSVEQVGCAFPALRPGDVRGVADPSGRPQGRLFFAGAYVDGGRGLDAALGSGRRAAREAAIAVAGPLDREFAAGRRGADSEIRSRKSDIGK
jgi:monoamine oxidase